MTNNLFLVAKWISDSFPIIRIVMLILMAVLAVVLVIIIMLQPSNSGGMGAISGNSDTFFSKNKEKTIQGTLKRLTIVISVALFLMAILFFLSLVVYNGTI